MLANRPLILLIPALAVLAACSQGSPAPTADDRGGAQNMSCAELADRKAASQYASDSALFDLREGGAVEASALSRDLIGMEANAYREKVYRDCLRLRGAQQPEAPAPEGN